MNPTADQDYNKDEISQNSYFARTIKSSSKLSKDSQNGRIIVTFHSWKIQTNFIISQAYTTCLPFYKSSSYNRSSSIVIFFAE